MLARIQEYAPRPLSASDPVVKQPAAAGEEFSVSLDQATLTLLLDDLSKLGIDTSKLKISSDPAQPAATDGSQQPPASSASGTALPPRLTPFAPAVSSAVASDASKADSDAQFVPEFLQDVKVFSVYGTSSGLNPAYFATRATAQWIANKYGTGEVVEVPYEGNGGPYMANANEFQIRLRNGKLTNAGTLADYYRRMPEDQFPGVADYMIRSVLISDNGPGIV